MQVGSVVIFHDYFITGHTLTYDRTGIILQVSGGHKWFKGDIFRVLDLDNAIVVTVVEGEISSLVLI